MSYTQYYMIKKSMRAVELSCVEIMNHARAKEPANVNFYFLSIFNVVIIVLKHWKQPVRAIIRKIQSAFIQLIISTTWTKIIFVSKQRSNLRDVLSCGKYSIHSRNLTIREDKDRNSIFKSFSADKNNFILWYFFWSKLFGRDVISIFLS